ncbi:hypothetical protein ACSQ67_025314 [Phaseolus vulgaris]
MKMISMLSPVLEVGLVKDTMESSGYENEKQLRYPSGYGLEVVKFQTQYEIEKLGLVRKIKKGEGKLIVSTIAQSVSLAQSLSLHRSIALAQMLTVHSLNHVPNALLLNHVPNAPLANHVPNASSLNHVPNAQMLHYSVARSNA